MPAERKRVEVTTPAVKEAHHVLHVFVHTGGIDPEHGYAAVRRIWTGARDTFQLDQAVPELGVPDSLPGAVAQLPPFPDPTRPAVLVAARTNPERTGQALVRRHHDTLNLSVVVPAPVAGSRLPGWQAAEEPLLSIIEPVKDRLMGVVHLYAATLEELSSAQVLGEPGALRDYACALLPALPTGRAGATTDWCDRGVDTGANCILWEIEPGIAGRVDRRLLAIGDGRRDADFSALIWSAGTASIPQLGRYLLHAAKLRHQVRVWSRDHEALRRPMPTAEKAEAVAMVKTMELATEMIMDNMASALGAAGIEAVDRGLFAEDRYLAAWFHGNLADEVRFLEMADTAASRVSVEAESDATDPDYDRRRVFVVHGRDLELCGQLFAFLRSVGLQPLEWESVVRETGQPTPYLRSVIAKGLASAGAIIVLLTADDTVQLHGDLVTDKDDLEDVEVAMQARPNVYLELGMALMMYPTRTIIAKAGRMREASDLSGLNYVDLTGTAESARKLLSRLHVAGCFGASPAPEVEEPGPFGRPTAWKRKPEGAPDRSRFPETGDSHEPR